MKVPSWVWLAGGAGLLVYLTYSNRQGVADVVQSGMEDVKAAVSGWQSVGQGPLWMPVFNAAERQYGIPTNLLARIGYQESRFRQDVIDGSTPGGAGELGIMQLRPIYFASVLAPLPFTDQDTAAQIDEAAQLLTGLYTRFKDWGLAIAAYNDGAGNIDAYLSGQHALPKSTATYVADVLADVPVTGASLPA